MSNGRGNTNGGSSATGPPGSCQDCGNKAKRDCEHMRCRTCCKTRGFHCPTHVRSTWVPVARRRQLLHHRLSLSASFPRAPIPAIRLLPSSSSPSSSGLQGNPSLPAEVTAVANFRSVRVRSVDDNAVDQAAYQASVTIAGRSFKGILYEQGPPSFPGGGGESSSTDHQYLHHHHHHHLLGLSTHPGGTGGGGGSTSTAGAAGTVANQTYAAYTHQYPLYASAAPFNPTFLPVSGVQFFPSPKP